MAYTTIDDPSAHFQTTIYTGNDTDGTQITNSGNSDLKPDLLWIKNRTDAGSAPATGGIWDSTRGFAENKVLTSFTNNAEGANANGFAVATTDGFTVEDGTSGANPRTATNKNAKNYVAWQWKANGGTTSSNTDGDITATVQANTTAGFSIMTWTSNNADNQTIGHGLGAAPEVFWVKIRDATGSWYCYFKEAGATHYLTLNGNGAKVDNVIWGDTHPTSSVITVDTNSLSGSTPTVVSYAFKQIQGYSKFGSYTGNGSTDGPFVYTGFRPAWLLIKRTSNADKWFLWDIKRDTFNVMDTVLSPDVSDADNTDTAFYLDMLSNGFKLKSTFSGINLSGDNYIYMAFAEHPFVSSKGVPVTAK